MKQIRFIVAAMLVASMACFTACEEADPVQGDNNTETPGGNDDGSDDGDDQQGGNAEDLAIGGRVTEDLTLEEGKSYTLKSALQVVAPATLTIGKGVTVTAEDTGEAIYILIEQGAKIMAQGTSAQPITLTAEKKEAGAWGGIHICGKAHTNAEGGTGKSEIGNATYGGNDDADNSGVLEYVRIQYSGFAFDEEHESNGVSLYGVGSGTKISHVQVIDGSDDGIEFFGGAANIDHCIVENCTDDSFDWTEGWNGKAEYIVAYQTLDLCDCLMECDNNGDNNDASPVAFPTIRYATFVGVDGEGDRGLRFREGTKVNLSNALVSGKSKSITLETRQTIDSFVAAENPSVIAKTFISGTLVNNETTGSESTYTNEMFVTAGNTANYDFSKVFTNGYVGTVAVEAPQVAEGDETPAADFAGAVPADNDWTAGWTL